MRVMRDTPYSKFLHSIMYSLKYGLTDSIANYIYQYIRGKAKNYKLLNSKWSCCVHATNRDTTSPFNRQYGQFFILEHYASEILQINLENGLPVVLGGFTGSQSDKQGINKCLQTLTNYKFIKGEMLAVQQ